MQLLLNKKEWNIIGSKTSHYNKLRALLRRVFPNYISFTTSLTSASQKKQNITHILTKMAPVAVFSFFGPIILALCIKSVTVLIFC